MTSLTRPRHNQLIDFLFGFAVLAGVSIWVGRLYAPLGFALFVVVVVAYLVDLRRTEKAAAQVGSSAQTGIAAPFGTDALDELANKLESAPDIPLTGEARIEAAEITPLLTAVRSSAGSEQAEELVDLLLNAPRVPFTGQVRFDRQWALGLLKELRTSVSGD